MNEKGMNRLKEFLSAKHYMSRKILDGLNKQDFENIRGIAVGEITEAGRGDRIKALQIVAYFGSQRDSEILEKIIGNDSEDISLRTAAAVNMAYLTSKPAEKSLIKHLKVQDNLIRSKVIKSLGMIGGPNAYEALLKIDNDQANFVKKQLTFAKALIAYRHNLDGDPLPYVEGVDRDQRSADEILKLSVKKVGIRKIRTAMERFEGSTYGIELAKTSGFEVTAGKARWLLFINELLADQGIFKSISDHKMITGLLSRWIRETNTYNAQYVVLTKPVEDKKVQILVIRSDGEIFYSGEATVKEKSLSFLISDIKRPGTAPTRVRGKLTVRGIELDISIPVSKRENKRSPITIEADDFYNKFSDHLK